MLGIRRWRSDRTPPRSSNTLNCSYECVRKHLKVALGNLLSSPPTMQTRWPRPTLVYSKAPYASSGGREWRESLTRRASAAPRLRGGGWAGGGRRRRPQVEAGGRPQVGGRALPRGPRPSRGAVDQVAGGAAARSGRRNRRLVDVAVGARRARAALAAKQRSRHPRERYVDRATIRGSERKPPTAREISP